MRGPADSAFHVTDGPVTDPGYFRQFFLSQPAAARSERSSLPKDPGREQLGHLAPIMSGLDNSG